VLRVSRQTAGRKGKVVTVVTGVAAADRKAVAGDLKRLCGTGGAVKDDAVEIQGDHRDRIVEHLRARGHQVKLAGG
jgi:translation initiation factor 1